jgi:hypothetical protein
MDVHTTSTTLHKTNVTHIAMMISTQIRKLSTGIMSMGQNHSIWCRHREWFQQMAQINMQSPITASQWQLLRLSMSYFRWNSLFISTFCDINLTVYDILDDIHDCAPEKQSSVYTITPSALASRSIHHQENINFTDTQRNAPPPTCKHNWTP